MFNLDWMKMMMMIKKLSNYNINKDDDCITSASLRRKPWAEESSG